MHSIIVQMEAIVITNTDRVDMTWLSPYPLQPCYVVELIFSLVRFQRMDLSLLKIGQSIATSKNFACNVVNLFANLDAQFITIRCAP
jgi:hypothetical protein